MTKPSISPFRLMREMVKVDQLRELLGDDDAKLLFDALEGETEALEIIDRFVELVLADDALVKAGEERLKRIKQRSENRRGVLMQIMEKLPDPYCKRLQRPLYTASIGYRSSPRITDQTMLPPDMWRHAPDMAKIGKALKDGKEIRGAEMGNAHPVLTIRKD